MFLVGVDTPAVDEDALDDDDIIDKYISIVLLRGSYRLPYLLYPTPTLESVLCTHSPS